MNEAQELLALRHHLATHLDPDDATHLAWPVIASIARPAIAQGWGGVELAATAMLSVYSGGIENPSAYIVANLRDLAGGPPPREVTPSPPHISEVLHTIHSRNETVDNPSEWANRIRAGLHRRAQ